MLARQEYLQQPLFSKAIQSSVVQLNEIEQWHQNSFALHQMDPSVLSCPRLSKYKQFKDLIGHLSKFNQRVVQKKNLPADTDTVRVFSGLFRQIGVLISLEDADYQLKQLQRIHSWFRHWVQRKDDNLREKLLDLFEKQQTAIKGFSPIRETRVSQDIKRKQNSTKLPERQPEVTNSQLPSIRREQQLRLYFSKKRTLHQNDFKPSERLSQYKRRNYSIASRIQSKIAQQAQTRKRMNTNYLQPSYVMLRSKQQQKLEVGIPDNQQTQPSQVKDHIADLIVSGPQKEQQLIEQEVQQDVIETKRGKLDPTIKPFTKVQGQATSLENNQMYLRGQRRFRIERAGNQAKLAFDLKIKSQLKQWSRFKAKTQSETNRRLNSKVLGNSYFQGCAQLSKPLTEQTIEAVTNQTKRPILKLITQPAPELLQEQQSLPKANLRLVKQRFGQAIGLQQIEGKYNPDCLSVFTRGRSKTSVRKDFCSILMENSRDNARIKSLQQIEQLKDSLPKYKALAGGLLIPEEGLKNEAILLPELNLPSNPFLIKAKKKKKSRK